MQYQETQLVILRVRTDHHSLAAAACLINPFVVLTDYSLDRQLEVKNCNRNQPHGAGSGE